MAFSLVGFGAGLAESVTERIEEERKFSNLALQGRIERASVLKMQRDKEAEAIKQELTAQRASLEQFGITDPELQKAYLSAPTAAEALKKTLEAGNIGKDAVNQYAREFITINQSRLFQGTPDDMIKAAAAARAGIKVEPARVLSTEGGGMLAPSVDAQQRRFEQLASARGLTLEDIARAESATAPARPEVAASINFEKLRKPEKEDVDDKLKRLLKVATDAEIRFGKGDQRAIAAAMEYNAYSSSVNAFKLNDPSKQTHSELLQRYQAILYNPNSRASPEEKEEARMYVDNYNQDKNRLEKLGKPNDKMPTENVMANGMSARAANAVMLNYGDRVGNGFVENRIQTGPTENDYIIDLRVTQGDRKLRSDVLLLRQKAAMSHPEVIAEMAANNNTIKNTTVKNALSRFGIDFTKDGVPILVNEQGSSLKIDGEQQPLKSTTQSTPNREPTAAATRPGVRIGRTVAPAPLPPTSIARPTTEDEVKALKPGTLFINPSDGKTYTKN